MGTGSARAHGRTRLHGHARRFRGAVDRDDPQGPRRRSARHRTDRLGVQRVLPREPLRSRRGRLRHRPGRSGPFVRRRPRAVRGRAPRRRARTEHDHARDRARGSRDRRGRDTGGRVRCDRACLPEHDATSHVRGVVDRVGTSRGRRTGVERRDRVGVRMAVGLPRLAAVGHSGCGDDNAGVAGTRAARRRRTRRPPATARSCSSSAPDSS